MALSKAAQAELDALRMRHGHVSPAQVVKFARDERTELHKHFLWDDTEAAKRYRLVQAGQLIRLYVIVRDESKPPIRGLVSLLQDRDSKAKKPGNGIRRHIDDVMSDDGMRANLLETALMELRAFKRKYEALTELSAIWNELDKLEATHPSSPETAEARASA